MKNDKKYLTPGELARSDWFPIKSENTIRTLIKTKKIKAIDVSAVEGKVRFAIPYDEAIDYLKNLKSKLK